MLTEYDTSFSCIFIYTSVNIVLGICVWRSGLYFVEKRIDSMIVEVPIYVGTLAIVRFVNVHYFLRDNIY